MEKLTEHFTLGEMCKTTVKTADGNIPSHEHIENLKRLCGWLERLRRRSGTHPQPLPRGGGIVYHEEPIIINSGFRSPAVNRAVGGAKNSNHLTGCAADIRVAGIEQLIRYAAILLDIADERLRVGASAGMSKEGYDELIIEKKGTSVWVHFAVRPNGNRGKVTVINKS